MLRTSYVASPAPTKEFLESGCALIIATVDADGEPHAGRGWGLDVLEPNRFRLLVDADDLRLRANLAANGSIAVTATHVPTLRSIQLKGHAVETESRGDADIARMRRFCDQFFADVEATDGVAPSMMERLVPARLSACEVRADAIFDQTPGPGAGSSLSS